MSLTFAVLLAGHLLQSGELPKLPAFPSEWRQITPVAGEMRDGQPIARLAAPEGSKTFTATSFTLKNPPLNRDIHFTVFIRQNGPGAASTMINAFAYSDVRNLVHQSTKPILTKDGAWIKAEADVVAPTSTTELAIWVVNTGKDPIDLNQPSISLGAPHLVALGGSGLLRASSQTAVSGKAGEIRFPVPSPYRDQAPLSFKITANPPEGLKSWKLEKRTPTNWVCVAQVSPPEGKKVILRWESLVLIRKSETPPLPKAEFGPYPAEAQAWLKASPVVQSDDPAIIAKAEELKTGCKDLEEFVRKVIDFTCRNRGTGVPFDALDAKTALGCGGSCTSRSNLGAALLRAAGVPARTVPHLPTWAYGSPLYEHWLTEYWHPGAGWVWVETTLGEFQPDPSTIAALAVSTIEDEQKTGQEGQYDWIMHGAAWMSGIQGFGGLENAAAQGESDASWCKPERRFNVPPELFQAATAAWPNVTDPGYVRKVEASKSTGDLVSLLAARRSGK